MKRLDCCCISLVVGLLAGLIASPASAEMRTVTLSHPSASYETKLKLELPAEFIPKPKQMYAHTYELFMTPDGEKIENQLTISALPDVDYERIKPALQKQFKPGFKEGITESDEYSIYGRGENGAYSRITILPSDECPRCHFLICVDSFIDDRYTADTVVSQVTFQMRAGVRYRVTRSKRLGITAGVN